MDIDMDQGSFGVKGGQMAMIVQPNQKCRGCLHYETNRTACLVGLVPADCGDGSQPETSYSPVTPEPAAYSEWKAKQGLKYNAPRPPSVGPAGSDAPQHPVNVQVLGGEGYLALSLPGSATGVKAWPEGKSTLVHSSKTHDYHAAVGENGSKHQVIAVPKGGGKPQGIAFVRTAAEAQVHAEHHAKTGEKLQKPNSLMKTFLDALNSPGLEKAEPTTTLHTTVAGFMAGLKALPKVGPHRGKFITAHMNHAPFVAALHLHPEGKQLASMLHAHLNSKKNATSAGAGSKVSLSLEALHDKRAALQKSDKARAIASAAWQRIPPGKKAKYIHRAMVRHKAEGESVVPEKYENRAPREFLTRLARKGFVEEFGNGIAGMLYKARSGILKAGGGVPPVGPQGKAPKATRGASDSLLAQVRTRQQAAPSLESKQKAVAAGGGKVFSHKALAEHLGVKPEGIAAIAHGSAHAVEFARRIRQQAGTKAKHLTDGQLRSAYHSTGLMHSMTNLTSGDLSLIKSHKAGKRHVVGHTSTGKPVHSDAFGAEELNEEEHREAGELHNDLAGRLTDAAFGHGGSNGYIRGKLPAAAHKYMMKLAEHHSGIAGRHRETARILSAPAPVSAIIRQPFERAKKSLSNNPSDAEIAKVIAESGGVAIGGLVAAPVNARPKDTGRLYTGLPSKGVAAPLPENPTPVKVVNPAEIFCGGVPSSVDNYR